MASTDLLEALRVARQDAEDAKVKLFFLKDLLLSSIIPSTATLRPGERLAQAGPILAAPSTAQPPAFRSWLAENGFIGKNRRSPGHAAVGELFETNADAAALMGEALGSLVADHLNLSLVQRRLEEEGFPEFPPPSVEDSARRATAPSVDSLPNISADALVQRLLAERKEAQRLKRAVQRADPSARIADDGHLYSWADAERYVNSLAEESAALREEKEVLSAECQRLSEELGRQRWKGPDAQSNEVAARNQAIGDWAWFDDRKYDFFISYRVESESFLAKELYFRLKLKEYPEKHDVFLDAEKLTDGEDWRDGFVQGLKSAKVIVLLVSRKAMERLKRSDSFVDNLLLEWETSLIASELGYCAVLPS
ncbi:hypothetical protein DFJ73DRAFT_339424 [Zopfochytrium polystomum]|nr:hypothetical protein DFJ73DRAFT_339424 [Zopfochytrium polystomum]